MPALAAIICGFAFGWGLTISGMIQPGKVLAFLDVFGIAKGAWDPSLAVVMAAGLAVAGIGYALARRRPPLFGKESLWPTKKDIDFAAHLGSNSVRRRLGSGWTVSRTGGRESGDVVAAGDALHHRHDNRHAGV
jgi:uncharacterized protein